MGFDSERLEVTAGPVPVLDDLIIKQEGSSDFSVSQNGSLAYLRGEGASELIERCCGWIVKAEKSC